MVSGGWACAYSPPQVPARNYDVSVLVGQLRWGYPAAAPRAASMAGRGSAGEMAVRAGVLRDSTLM